MDLQLAGKTALVTGGNRGTGRVIAERLAAEGARVVVHGFVDADADKAAAKAKAVSDASAAVNAQWRAEPLEIPANASILEGESGGNTISFKAGASLGKYFYVRFYAISGEDTSEQGTLQLGVFIVGGKSAKIKLPTGYYRVNCVAGESWYGLERLFGSDAKTYNGGSAIRSRDGYVNNISFE